MAYVVTGYWGAGYDDQQSSADIISELQGIAPTEIIELFQLELNADQHGVDQTYYFHNGTGSGGNSNLVFGGIAYIALPIEADGFAYSGQGSLPRPTLRASNLFNTITALISTLPNGLEGAKVTRIRTLARYIDDVNFPTPYGTPDSTAIFPKEIYYVDRKSTENRSVIEFELASAFDMAGVRAPKRQCVSRCQWVYKSAECGYIGTDYFDVNDSVVANSLEDVCGKKQSSCEARFGKNNELPFGGYPGIGTFFA